MVNSLAARRGLKRLRTGMLIGSGVLVLLGLAIVLFLSGTLWPSVVAGVGGGAVMLGALDLDRGVEALPPHIDDAQQAPESVMDRGVLGERRHAGRA